MNVIERIHGGYVYNRRIRVLCRRLSRLIPQNARLLDVGCGDGLLTRLICRRRPDISAQGIDVLVREETYIPVRSFDGARIPFDAETFDAVMFVDVLHHTADPAVLLAEAARVSRKTILLKDHTRNGLLAGPTLRFMDWVGNVRHGVALPYNYWPERRWRETFNRLGLSVKQWRNKLRLYPWPASLLFDRSLHFIAELETKDTSAKAHPA